MRNVPPEKGFLNHSGNLRSSMGYMVFVDGVAVHSSTFEKVPSVNNPPEGTEYNGSETGKNLCESIGKDTEGVALVCVAGMNYALYVESKGRDVLSGAENLAKEELPKMLEQLINNIHHCLTTMVESIRVMADHRIRLRKMSLLTRLTLVKNRCHKPALPTSTSMFRISR